MKIKITNRTRDFRYAELFEGYFVEAIRTATYGMDDQGDKELYFIVGKDADLSIETIDHVLSAIVKVFGSSLVWDIVTELPKPLCAEDGVTTYLYISQ